VTDREPAARFLGAAGASYTATMAVRALRLSVAPRVRIELRGLTCAGTRNAVPCSGA